MGSTYPNKLPLSDLGITISDDAGEWTITFDLKKIERFMAVYGSDAFLAAGCRHVEQQCEEHGLLDDLWLWSAAVKANA